MSELFVVSDSTMSTSQRELIYVPYYSPESKKDIRDFAYSHMTSSGPTIRSVKLERNIKRLKSYLTLPENWNESHTEPFTLAFIDRVIAIIKNLQVQPEVFPLPDAAIQVEYENESNQYLEFDIYEDRIEAFRMDGKVEIFDKEISVEELINIVDEFHAS